MDLFTNLQSLLQFKDANNNTENTENTFLLEPDINIQIPETILTHQVYLNLREKEKQKYPSFFNYLNFNKKTYTTNLKDSLSRCWTCAKCSFYFFVQGFYPDLFQHYAPDLLIKLSENILDEYANCISV